MLASSGSCYSLACSYCIFNSMAAIFCFSKFWKSPKAVFCLFISSPLKTDTFFELPLLIAPSDYDTFNSSCYWRLEPLSSSLILSRGGASLVSEIGSWTFKNFCGRGDMIESFLAIFPGMLLLCKFVVMFAVESLESLLLSLFCFSWAMKRISLGDTSA